ncbi:hypothetical protein ACNKCJ_001245 [Cronobacter dublinensis]|nr:hypothetical protein [Cronobacter dublinensis]EKY3203762.1 hypothetical protein [Cronobacter dublinensis]EKY3244147.1 hypothetical protein [Cronobacter dublinensis]ELQ6158290.1 hypothetical protein [Cronobacter dublinensis]ELY2817922.1 hypothetical protein [Cronobacter dublinensis]
MICAHYGLMLNFAKDTPSQGDTMLHQTHLMLFRQTTLLLAALLTACSLAGNYQARAHEQLTDLMATHLQLIDDFTAPSAELDNAALAKADHDMRLRFAQAIAYAESLHDTLRTDNLRLLQSVYRDDHARLVKQNHPFSPAQAVLWREQARLAYLEALRGECSRHTSPCQ